MSFQDPNASAQIWGRRVFFRSRLAHFSQEESLPAMRGEIMYGFTVSVLLGLCYYFYRVGSKNREEGILESLADEAPTPPLHPRDDPPQNADALDADTAAETVVEGSTDEMATAVTQAAAPESPGEELTGLADAVLAAYPNRKDPDQHRVILDAGRKFVEKTRGAARFESDDPDATHRQSVYKMLAITLEEDLELDEALSICRIALEQGLSDGTKTGFAGRIDRLNKKYDRLEKSDPETQ